MSSTTPFSVTVLAHDRADLTWRLKQAIRTAAEHARVEGLHGVLVVRQGLTSYAVEATGEVPFGFTQERDDYQRSVTVRAPRPMAPGASKRDGTPPAG